MLLTDLRRHHQLALTGTTHSEQHYLIQDILPQEACLHHRSSMPMGTVTGIEDHPVRDLTGMAMEMRRRETKSMPREAGEDIKLKTHMDRMDSTTMAIMVAEEAALKVVIRMVDARSAIVTIKVTARAMVKMVEEMATEEGMMGAMAGDKLCTFAKIRNTTFVTG